MVVKKTKKTEKDLGGRPPKYNPKYSTQEYVNGFISYCRVNSEPEVIMPDLPDEETKGMIVKPIVKKRLMLPTIERFAKYIGVHFDTLYDWAKVHPKFSESLSKIKEEQKEWLFDNGLLGEYNPVIAKLILSSNHGMSDKVDNKTTIEDKNGVLRSLFNAAQGDGTE